MSQTAYTTAASTTRRDDGDDDPNRDWKLSWGAIIAGVLIVLAVQLLLSLLGLSVGFGLVEPATNGTPGAADFGIGAGVWWVVSYVIALIAGGYVAARLAAAAVPLNGMLQGIVTWALALMVTLYLLGSAVGGIVGGASSLLGGAASSATQGLTGAVPQLAQSAGVPTNPTGEQAKQLLRTTTGPSDPRQLTDAQAESEIGTLLPQLAVGGEQAASARDRIATIMAARRNIPKPEALAEVSRIEAQAGQTTSQAAGTATQAANQTATGLSWGTLLTFVGLTLGALAAALGGRLGTRKRHHREHHEFHRDDVDHRSRTADTRDYVRADDVRGERYRTDDVRGERYRGDAGDQPRSVSTS